MNERIRLLAEQAGLITLQDDRENWHEYINDVEKFAELIVQECLNICRECIEDGCVEAEEPLWKIQTHFGVEE